MQSMASSRGRKCIGAANGHGIVPQHWEGPFQCEGLERGRVAISALTRLSPTLIGVPACGAQVSHRRRAR